METTLGPRRQHVSSGGRQSSAKVRVLITGGGTGGHVYPGLAVAEALRERAPGAQVRFAGTRRGIEAVLVPQAGYQLYTVPASGLRGLGHRARVLFVLNFVGGFLRSLALMLRWRPAVVLGTGGFVSAPVMTAARVLRIVCTLQEQNAVPGSTNRLVGRWARRIYLGFAAAAPFFRTGVCRATGNPVRRSFIAAATESGSTAAADEADLQIFGRHGGRVLIFGGSGGARRLNEAVLAAAPQWGQLSGAAFLVQTGKAAFAPVRDSVASEQVRVTAYIDDMAAALRWADLVVCRAGAMTLAELQVVGRPALLVPFPHATDNHQLHNARDLEKAGAALVLADENCDGTSLTAAIAALLADPQRLAEMAAAAKSMGRPRAAPEIAGDLLELAGHPAGLRLASHI
jgi:UDP-N-acetylglucosamine--N-acetylmuramyl-(pentapeptide) pyrophosphoryl-undecaprenol N-acetylglucosamine transferase